MTLRLRAVLLSFVCVVAVGLSAGIARAGLLDSLGGVLDQLLDGGADPDTQLGEELADLLCDPTSDLAEGIESGALSALPADVIPALTCNLGLLDYKFQTTFKRSDGTEIVRTHSALVQIPRLLNVDADIAPDLIGTIGLSGAGRFTLRVNRMLGETAALPTKVEALISAPIGVDIGRDSIAFGYDTTTSRAPKTFNSGISLLSLIGPGGPGIKFQTDVTGAGPSLALIGELFDKGPGDERRSPMRARVGFTPVPATLTATVDLGNPVLATVTTSQRSKVDVLGQLISTPAAGPSTERRIDAVIDSLPSTVSVSYLSGGEFQRTVTYDASDPIGRIDVTYTEKIGTAIDQKAVVTVKDLPKGLVVNQTGEVDADMHTTQGAIGEVYGSFANGEPQPAPAEPGVHVFSQGDYSSVGFRARGIEALDAQGAAPYMVDATLARQPFGVLIEDPDAARMITATLDELPHHFRVNFDPEAGGPPLKGGVAGPVVVFDGFGEGIGTLDVVATDDRSASEPSTEDGFGPPGVRRIEAFVDDLPDHVTVDYVIVEEEAEGEPPANTTLDVSTSAPVGSLEALVTTSQHENRSREDLATDINALGADELALIGDPTRSGVIYSDTGPLVAFARVKGLSQIELETKPVRLHTEAGADQRLDLYVNQFRRPSISGGYLMTVDAVVDPLPATLTFELTSDPATTQTKIDYEASTSIDLLQVDARNLMELQDFTDIPSIERVDMLARIEGIPKEVEVFVGGTDCAGSTTVGCGNVVDVDILDATDPTLDQITFKITEEGEEAPPLPFDGAIYHPLRDPDEDEHYEVVARLSDFQNLDVSTAPTLTNLDLDLDIPAGEDGRRFDYDLLMKDPDGSAPFHPRVITGQIKNPPPDTSVELRPLDNKTIINYDAGLPIEALTLDMGAKAESGPSVKPLVSIDLSNLPTIVDACVGVPSDCDISGFDTSGTAFGGESHNLDTVGAFFQSNAPDAPSPGAPDEQIGLNAYVCLKAAPVGCDNELRLGGVRFTRLAAEALLTAQGYLYADSFGTLLKGNVEMAIAKDRPGSDPRFLRAALGGGVRLDERTLDFPNPIPGGDAFCAPNMTLDVLIFGGLIKGLFCNGTL